MDENKQESLQNLKAELSQWKAVAEKLVKVVDDAEGWYMPEGDNQFRRESRAALAAYKKLRSESNAQD